MAKKNHYQVLGVGVSAGTEDIKAAWKVAARKWHPDTNKEPAAHANFLAAREAYAVLSDAESRSAYNKKLPTHTFVAAQLRESDRLTLANASLVKLRSAYNGLVAQPYLSSTDRRAAAVILREIHRRTGTKAAEPTPASSTVVAIWAGGFTFIAVFLLYAMLKLVLTK